MKVSVVGSGYVGLVTATCLAKLGHTVHCVDLDQSRIELISAGIPPIVEPSLEEMLKQVLAEGNLRCTTDLAHAIQDSEIAIVAVGTPTVKGEIDLSFVERAGEQIGKAISDSTEFHTIILKSTCVPGTTNGLFRDAIERGSGKIAHVDFGLGYNPEFLREGSAVEDFMHADRIVLGCQDDKTRVALETLYAAYASILVVMSSSNAELTKYANNCLLATLISFSNEIGALCEKVDGLDESEVMRGVHLDRRWLSDRGQPGILSYLRAGIGYGGSCFPKDTQALLNFGQNNDVQMRVLKATIETNDGRASQIVNRLGNIFALKGAKVAVLGLAFKPMTDDTRLSPSWPIIEALHAAGATVAVWDPAAEGGERVPVERDIYAALDGASCLVLATAWPQLRDVDWARASEIMKAANFFDGRCAFEHDESVRRSFRYLKVGRT